MLQPPDEQERKVLLERLLKEAAADSVAHLEKDSSSRSAEAAVEAKAALTLDPKDLSLVAAGTVLYQIALKILLKNDLRGLHSSHTMRVLFLPSPKVTKLPSVFFFAGGLCGCGPRGTAPRSGAATASCHFEQCFF